MPELKWQTLTTQFSPFIKTLFQFGKILVTFNSKYTGMKKTLVAVVLLAGVTAVAFASFNNNRKKAGIENRSDDNRMEKKKKECSHTCPFS